MLALTHLYGEADQTIAKARKSLPALPEIVDSLNRLESLIQALSEQVITIDLADMGGSYGYHTGVVFSVYADGWHDALVRGGRYDGVGAMYGRSRPATGFSLDLRKLSGGLPPAKAARAIRAPWGNDASLITMLEQLREAGEIVIQMLPDQPHTLDEFIIDRELVKQDGSWQVRAVSA